MVRKAADFLSFSSRQHCVPSLSWQLSCSSPKHTCSRFPAEFLVIGMNNLHNFADADKATLAALMVDTLSNAGFTTVGQVGYHHEPLCRCETVSASQVSLVNDHLPRQARDMTKLVNRRLLRTGVERSCLHFLRLSEPTRSADCCPPIKDKPLRELGRCHGHRQPAGS